MKVAFGGFVEDLLGERRGGFRCRGPDGPKENIQLRRKCRDAEVRRSSEALVQFKCSRVTGLQTFCESAAGGVGEQLLRGPESDGGGAGTGALKGDLTEVKIF